MGQDAYAKSIRESEIYTKRQQEKSERNMLGALYSFACELGGKNDSAAELEAETKLDEAIESGKATNEIIELATDWYSEGKESGFRMGFHMATKLLMEGMNAGTM